MSLTETCADPTWYVAPRVARSSSHLSPQEVTELSRRLAALDALIARVTRRVDVLEHVVTPVTNDVTPVTGHVTYSRDTAELISRAPVSVLVPRPVSTSTP